MHKKIIKFILISIIIWIIIIFIISFISSKDTSKNIDANSFQTTEKIKEELDNKTILNIKENTPEKVVVKKIVQPFVCPKPKKEYDDMLLFNIGQNTGLPDTTYTPKNLKELGLDLSIRKEICLTKETMDAFKLMSEAAKKDKITIKISSGFRSYEKQKSLYEADLKKTGEDDSDSVANPGYSEHQLGTTIDITGLSINYASAVDNFNETVEDYWLRDNAYLYGFVQSYPEDKVDVTHYIYEPWHYRYIGIDDAKQIKDSGLTITEFLK